MEDEELTQRGRFERDRYTWLAYTMLAGFTYCQAVLGPAMPFLRTELGLSYTVGGLHLSAFAVGMILAGVVGDRVSHIVGRRRAFWGGGIGMAAGACLLGLGDRLSLTLTATLLMGTGGSLMLVTIQAGLADRHGDLRAVAFGESNLLGSMSAGLAPLMVGGFQRLGIGWRGALFAAAAAVALLAARFGRDPVPASKIVHAVQVTSHEDDGATERVRQAGRGDQHLPASLDNQTVNRLTVLYWAYWSVIVLSVAIEFCMILWSADYLNTALGLQPAIASATVSTFFLAMVVGRFIGSRLAARLPTSTLLLLAVAVTSVGFPLYWLSPFALLSIAGMFITGLGLSNLFPLGLSAATGAAPGSTDAASARVTLGAGLAVLTAPLALGRLADELNLRSAYAIVVVFLVLIAGVVLGSNYLSSRR